jgi:hypothetical protein
MVAYGSLAPSQVTSICAFGVPRVDGTISTTTQKMK